MPAGRAEKRAGGDKLRVRMYRVGFGDFFLLTVPTQGGPRHVLIDCGVHAGNLGSIGDAVDDLANVTGKHLSLIVVTHRHADHISGFATCAARFREFTVDAVWLSWWDDPRDPGASGFQATLVALASRLQLALAAREDDDSKQALAMAQNATGDGVMAAAGGSNAAALDLLRNGRFQGSPKPRYYKAGDEPELPAGLADAGLQAQILGPPISPDLVAQMRNASEEYLAAVETSTASSKLQPFDARWRVPELQTPPSALRPFADLAAIRQVLADAQPDAVAAAARRADNTLNNQSLVVLFTFRGKKLLFVGDAQWGNWEYFLYGGAADQTSMRPDAKSLLGSLDFYKVGHHGSTNATPIAAVDAMRDGLVAMCSTEAECYGKEDKGTEVPRLPLLDALQKKTGGKLACSDQVSAAGNKPLKARGNLAAPFSTKGDLFIDWEVAV